MPMNPLLLAAVLVLGGSAPAQDRDRRPREQSAPRLLTATGLYAEPASLRVHPGILPYSPQYPLWSDGAVKSRWVFLPKGKAINVSNPDAWTFPVGTKFWKEFSFKGRKVETRLLWHASANAWVYAAYAWRPDQTEADLVGDTGLRSAAEIAPGITHTIPGTLDCKSCHGNAFIPVLGFNTLQLSTDRDPNALHAEPLGPDMATLQTLVEQRLIQPVRREFVENPPRIHAANPRTRTALGYLSTNCGNCHRASSPIPDVSLDLRHAYGTPDEVSAPGLHSTLGRRTHCVIPDAVIETQAIAPGHPEASLIVYRMSSRRPISQMPPIGSALVDTEAVEFFRAWITQDLAPRTRAGSAGSSQK